MKITRQQLIEITESSIRTDMYLHYINMWLDVFHINTPLRVSYFMGQVLHETIGLRRMREVGDEKYCSKYEKGKLAKMLGNTQKGDGYKYKGRGFLMLTGRANYKTYQNSSYCKGDIMTSPELLESANGAMKSGAWYWWKHGLNTIADKDDILAVTKKVNGGTNGLEERKSWTEKCKKVLCK